MNPLEAELRSYIYVTENGRRKRITVDETIHKQLIKMAIEGDVQNMRLLMKLRYPRNSQIKNIMIESTAKTNEGLDFNNLTTDQVTQKYIEAIKNAKSAE